MRVISIANQKGGCGKTTTSINLAAALALLGRRILLIDLDPQAHASLGLDIDSNNSLYNVISRLTPRKMNLEDIIVRVENSFDVVPSNILVGTLEQELSDEIGRELKLSEIILRLNERYDEVLIDCPPSLGFLTVNAIRASSDIIIPVETSRFSLQGVERLLDITKLIQERLGHATTQRLLITMFDSRLRHSFSMLAKIREQFADKIFATMIHVNVKLKEAAFAGKTVANFDKYSRGFKDYYSFAKELLTLWQERLPSADTAGSRISSVLLEEPSGRQEVRVTSQLETEFSFVALQAQSVYITGTFNDWSLDETFRMKQENGRWVIRFSLAPGLYRYRFIVDGKWQEDPDNPHFERNPFGDLNSLIEVR